MSVSDLIAFLRARLDEREQVLRRLVAAKEDADACPGGWELWGEFGNLVTEVTNFRQMLAEVAAKRAIIDDCVSSLTRGTSTHPEKGLTSGDDLAMAVLLQLAQPHVGHPDFDPAWRVATL